MPAPDDSSPSLASPPSAAPPAAESLEAALATQDWPDLSRRLTKYAYFRLRKSSWETAEEIAQEAIVHLLDAAYAAWDRARHPDIFDCLGHLVNGIVVNHHRLRAVRAKHVVLREDAEVHDDELPEPEEETTATAKNAKNEESEEALPPPEAGVLLTHDRTPHDELTSTHHEELAVATLRARIAGDALCLELLDLIQSGVGVASAQAKTLGVAVADVYAAKRRLMHHARRVRADLAKGGES